MGFIDKSISHEDATENLASSVVSLFNVGMVNPPPVAQFIHGFIARDFSFKVNLKPRWAANSA